jgi:hypothetical protein
VLGLSAEASPPFSVTGEDVLHSEEAALQVDRHDAILIFLAHLDDPADRRDTGVVFVVAPASEGRLQDLNAGR